MMRNRLAAHITLIAALATSACGGMPALYGEGDGGPGADGGSRDGGGAEPPASCDNIVGSRKQQVCLHWTCGRKDMAEGAFSGNVAMCRPGEPDPVATENTLRVLNAYRFIADLPAVANDEARASKAQACSLMMDANNSLSHNPPGNWKCFSAEGAEAASKSNISTGAAVMSVDMYMKDFGNENTIGHRRWILSNALGPVGVGSAPGGSCLWVIEGRGTADKAFVAFPSPGPFPYQAINPGAFGSDVDKVGWTVQSESIDVSRADVIVTRDGQPVEVDVFPLPGGYGSKFAVRFTPKGWRTAAGHTYHVKLDGVSQPIEYDVEVVDCL